MLPGSRASKLAFMPTVHDYPIEIAWEGGVTGKGKMSARQSGSELPISVPPEFKGPGEGTNPEELLTASIAACYSITFGIIAENRKLPVSNIETTAIGEVEQNGAQFKYRAIMLKPRITLNGATDEQAKMAEDMAHKADSYCIVTNAVRGNVEIHVEPQIVRT